MSSLAIASIVFVCSFGSAALGMLLHVKLPERHLDANTREVVNLVMGLIGTIAALVLSLLIASASTSFDRQRDQLKSLSAGIILLDRTLVFYGPEAQGVRDDIRDAFRDVHQRIWSPDGVRPENIIAPQIRTQLRSGIEKLIRLAPQSDDEKIIKSQAVQALMDIAKTRLLMFEEIGNSISWPFMVVLVFWISMLFLGFGLFARYNITVVVAHLVGAICVSGAIFLIVELNDPYNGLMRISGQPLLDAVTQMDQ